MKKILLAFLLCPFLARAQSCLNIGLRGSLLQSNWDSTQWELAWQEEFDGDSLNTVRWFPRTIWGDADILSYMLPENNIVQNGMLNMRLQEQKGAYPVPWWKENPEMKEFDYTGAEIWSNEKFRYGYFETRIHVPRGKGLVTAFWLWGPGDDDGKAPIDEADDEIDVYEFECGKKDMIMTYHWCEKYIPVPDNPYDSCVHRQSARRKVLKGWAQGWHTIGMEWTPNGMIWYFDRKAVRSACHRYYYPMRVIYGISAMGNGHGGFEGPPEPGKLLLPAWYKVDYLRIYRKKGSDWPVPAPREVAR